MTNGPVVVEAVPELGPAARVRDRRWPPTVPLAIVAVLVLCGLFAPLLAPHSPVEGSLGERLVPPLGMEGSKANHPLGTDRLGRDTLSRLLYGARISLSVSVVGIALTGALGSLVGLLAGFLGGWVDIVLARLVDVLLAIPNFLLAVIVVTAIGFDTTNAAIATGVSAVAVFARVMRSEVIKIRQATFVEASFLLGGSRWHLLLRQVLPNAARPVFPLAVLQFGLSILVIASLACLGYGDPPPASDWGLLISIGKDYLKWPWLVYAPAFVTISTVLSVNRISRWLRKTD